MGWQVGDRVGDYEIIDILGAGGMGQVYKVRNLISDRLEAMKILLPDLANNAELAERFMREIKVQASLDHPNIAALHTAQRVGNQLIMVMEFVEGQNVERLLRNGPFPLNYAINFTQQVLSALSYAHARGVVHRDIKPPNIMLTANGVVKLMDFGIAKLAADPKLTQTGHTVGSLYYMSPEQINGANLDARSDLYSLGVTLYEMVTGRRPFQGDSDYSIMSAHLLSRPVPPIEVDPRVPDTLNEIILMSIAKDPAQRFQTADAFRAALGNAAAGLGVGPAVAGAAVYAPAATPVVSPTAQRTAPIVSPASTPVQPPTATQPVMAQPAASVASAAPAVAAAPQAPVRSASNKRGLYMALGSVATVVVLIVAAVEVPRFFRSTGATSQQTGTQAPLTSTPSQQQPSTQQQPDQQPAQPTSVAQPVASQPATQDRTPANRAAQTVAPVQSQPPTPRKSAMGQPVSQAPAQSSYAAPQQQQQYTAPSVQAPPQIEQPVRTAPPAPANSTEIAEMREQLMLLGTRASAVQQTIRTMQQQQARSGLGMRQDIVAGMDRMNAYLGEAEASLRSGDGAKGKRYLSSAERELDKLERFLGR